MNVDEILARLEICLSKEGVLIDNVRRVYSPFRKEAFRATQDSASKIPPISSIKPCFLFF